MGIDLEAFPPIICYRLTRTCNLHCIFCLASEYREDLSTEMVKLSILRLKDLGMQEIRFGGGEPTLRSDLISIIHFCLDCKLSVRLSSNLYSIDKIFKDLIQFPLGIKTSLHGSPEYHDHITGVPGSYEQTVYNISRLIQAGIDVSVHSTLTPDSCTYAEGLIQNLISIGVKKVSFQTVIPRERGSNISYLNLYSDVQNELQQIKVLATKYQSVINVKTIDLYKKFYYVFEPNGCLYLQKESTQNDIKVRRII